MTDRPEWHSQLETFTPRAFRCGHCGADSGSDRGWRRDPPGRLSNATPHECVLVCVRCQKPTHFEGDRQVPAPPYGGSIDHLPPAVEHVYAEARNCMLVEAYTASALMCRKLLMNVAHHQGAPEGQSFVQYVTFFEQNGYVPPTGRAWVDHMRKKGNEATHEIPPIARQDAADLLTFAEGILRVVFEFPGRLAARSG